MKNLVLIEMRIVKQYEKLLKNWLSKSTPTKIRFDRFFSFFLFFLCFSLVEFCDLTGERMVNANFKSKSCNISWCCFYEGVLVGAR